MISGTITAADADITFEPVVSVSDGTTGAAEYFLWTVDSPITLVPVADQEKDEGESVGISVLAGDSRSGASLTFSLSGQPEGIDINPSSGLISGTIAGGDDYGDFDPVITVGDGQVSSSESFEWSVNAPITLVPVAIQQNKQGDVVAIGVKAMDVNSGIGLTYSLEDQPFGVSINASTGVIAGTIGQGDNVGDFTPVVTVSDGAVQASESFEWSIVSPISLVPLADRVDNDFDVVAVSVRASDANSGATLTYTLQDQPEGVSINASTGLISGTITPADGVEGLFVPVITASDGRTSSSESFAWNINSPLNVAVIEDQQSSEGSTVSWQVLASDSRVGATLTYALNGQPPGIRINSSTGLISGTIAAGDGNSVGYLPQVTVTDGVSSNAQVFFWSIASAITIGGIDPLRNSEGDAVSLSVTASDTYGLPLTYGLEGQPAGVTINPSTGLISGTIAFGAANGGTAFTPVITVSDGTSSNSELLSWNLVEPIRIGGLLTQNGKEDTSVSLAVHAADGDGLSLTFSQVGLPAGLSINASTGLISGTIAEGAGNEGPAFPVITVTDGKDTNSDGFTWNLTPALSLATIADQEGAEGSTVSLALSASVAGSPSLTWSVVGLPAGLAINRSSGLISGTIAEGAGNQGPVSSLIRVTDGVDVARGDFTWNLESAISVGSIATQSNSEANVVTLALSATDANSLSLTWGAIGLPAGLSINRSTGLISGTIAAGAANGGDVYPVITVGDGVDAVSAEVTWNLSSGISLGSIAVQNNTEANSVSLALSASDANELSLTWSQIGLPAGLSIDATSGLISGTIAAGAANGGAVYPVIVVSDGVDTVAVDVTWNLTSGIALGTVGTLTSTAGSVVSLSVSATDDNGLSLTWSATDLPLGVAINPSTGLITGTVIAGVVNDAVLTPVIMASDGLSSASSEFTWNIGPVVQDVSFDTPENTALTIAASVGVLAGAGSAAGTTLTAELLTPPSDGTLTLAADGSFVYTPDSGWVGTDCFVYEASDGQVNSGPVEVTIQTNRTMPQANNDFVAVAMGDFNGDGVNERKKSDGGENRVGKGKSPVSK